MSNANGLSEQQGPQDPVIWLGRRGSKIRSGLDSVMVRFTFRDFEFCALTASSLLQL